MNKRHRLQALWDKFAPQSEEYHQFWIEYRPRQGWYAMPLEARHFTDEGEYLGDRFEDLNSEEVMKRIVSKYF